MCRNTEDYLLKSSAPKNFHLLKILKVINKNINLHTNTKTCADLQD